MKLPLPWVVLCISTLLRILLATAVPLDGDEVYYASWGLHPELMYTDHPPVVGWVYALVHWIWSLPSKLSLRMPWLVCMTLIGAMLLRLRKSDATRGSLLFHSHLLTYVPIFRPDHLVLLWITAAVTLLTGAQKRRNLFLLPLILVPLTKYLGILALPNWWRLTAKNRVIPILGAAAIAAGYILAANALTGWHNLSFTFGGRFSGHLSSLYGGGIGTFLAAWAIGTGPIAAFLGTKTLWEKRSQPAQLFTQSAAIYCGFLAVFALVSSKFQSAWIVPGVFLFLLGQATREKLPKSTFTTAIISFQAVLTALACIGVAAFRAGAFDHKIDPKRERAYLIALYQEPQAFSRWLSQVRGDSHLMTEGVAEAALLQVFLDPTTAVYPTGYHWFRDLQDRQNLGSFEGKAVTYLGLGRNLPSSLAPLCPEGWKQENVLYGRYLVPIARCARFCLGKSCLSGSN